VRVGHQADARTTFGPVNNANQFAYVKALAERARASGCEVIEYGEMVDPGRWDKGYYLRPRSSEAGCEVGDRGLRTVRSGRSDPFLR